MKPSETLQRARALIEDYDRWCTGTFRRGARRCVEGAFSKVSGGDLGEPASYGVGWTYVDELARAEWGMPAYAVNDECGHLSVLRLLDWATSAALSDEAAE